MNVDETIKKMKKIINIQIKKEKYMLALKCANTLANIYYTYNQIYTDLELEENLLVIRDAVLEKKIYEPNSKCVLFYDGFGLDLRGIAVVYARALAGMGYQIVYVCPSTSIGKIPHIISEFASSNARLIYIDTDANDIDKIKRVDSIFKEYRPKVAFFYTTPFDVDAAIAFSNNGCTTRFQLDLTDHAYWIGVNAFDFIINGRDIGASIAHFERGIPKERILKLDCAPYINKDKCDLELPFDINNEQYVFTGGALYKTLGDENLLYYKTIESILKNFSYIKFLYAGSGDDTEMRKLISKFPDRAYLINERPDFYNLIKKCILYINSYPMFGGLMMRYSALAGKIPITLKHDNDSDGILINQEKLGIEYVNYKEYIEEIYKLLSNEKYRHQKEKLVLNSVMTEEDFARNLKLLIEEHKTEYTFDEITKFDTTEFRKEYKKRYSISCLYKSMAQKSNINLLRYFPKEYIWGTLIKIKERLLK